MPGVVGDPGFEACVFINCPFDEDYDPILQAMLFCVLYLGFMPRIAKERSDGAENRLDKICEIIQKSKYSIHDLSRCQAKEPGEHFRLNMPLELGIDYGCRQYFGNGANSKKFLILGDNVQSFKAALSDMAAKDMESHAGKFDVAVRKIRNWLVNEADAKRQDAPRIILQEYDDFQEWHYERQLAAGFSEDDIKDYPTKELLDAMIEWIALGKPI